MKNQSDKKTCLNFLKYCNSGICVREFVFTFYSYFQVARHNRSQIAFQYLQGLLKLEKGKANMERMEEEIPDAEYHAYQHFLTESKWDYKGVLSKVARDVSDQLKANKAKSNKPTGLIMDESAHLKKGDKSVGVSKQYAGVVGKVENCQVGVYISMVNDKWATLVNERLYIPERWIWDKARCKSAGIPKTNMIFKTKAELAMEMVDQAIQEGIEFDWVGGDGFYGHNSQLRKGLSERGVFYVLDVHKDETIFVQEPVLEVPARSNKRGRPSQKPQPNIEPTRLDHYLQSLTDKDWHLVKKIRRTHKGWKNLNVHTCPVWVLQEGEIQQLTLMITQTTDGKKITKYSFSNGDVDQYTPGEYAYYQCQRYWVERTFDDAKSELGMSDYQIRKWNGWHHHHALVLMAGLFLMKQKMEHQQEAPLMSVRDARILMIVSLFGTEEDMEMRLQQMQTRHQKIQADIDRHYKT